MALPTLDQPLPPVRRYAWLAAGIWTALVAASLVWSLSMEREALLEVARTEARVAFDKDILYRRWNASLGGVYVPETPATPANPYLKAPEKDITTPGGRRLTLMNPAYMTRLVHELGRQASGTQGHLTSLKPLNPANTPDPWEAAALLSFEKGAKEASALETRDGRPYLRLMRPLPYEEACGACHGQQGYQPGDVRGGLSALVPMAPLETASQPHVRYMLLAYAGLWLVGLAGVAFGASHISRPLAERQEALEARERALADLLAAQAQVKTLAGLLPICASCKKIRDEAGQWQELESYIGNHSQADFTHSICPECAQRLYPELMKPGKET